MVSAVELRLGWSDYLVIGFVVLGVLALGFSAKLRDLAPLQFIAAGRRLTLPAFVATLVCTWYGGVLGVGESVTWYGLGAWLMLGWPYYVFGVWYALVMAPRVRAAAQISLPERMAARFGKATALIGAALIFLLAVPAAHVLMLGTLIHIVSGWGVVPSVLVGTVVGTAFVYKGGLLADVRVSLLSFVLMYVSFGVMLFACSSQHAWSDLAARFTDPQRLQITGGQSLGTILTFFLLGAWTFVDPGFHQRTASAESPTTARRGVLIAVLCWMVFDLLTIGTGLYAVGIFSPDLPPGLELFPALAERVLPSGWKGLFLAGLLGTIVTALVGYALVSGATFGRDIVSRIVGDVDSPAATAWSRRGIGIASLVAVVLATSLQSVVELWYAWGGCVVGALLVPVMLSYLSAPQTAVAPIPPDERLPTSALTSAHPRPRHSIGGGWIAGGMLAGFGCSLAFLIYGKTTNEQLLATWGTLFPALAASCVVLGVAWAFAGKGAKE